MGNQGEKHRHPGTLKAGKPPDLCLSKGTVLLGEYFPLPFVPSRQGRGWEFYEEGNWVGRGEWFKGGVNGGNAGMMVEGRLT